MDDLRRIVHALRSSHRAAAHLHLTGAQLFVLHVLAEADGPLSVSDIARETHTDQSTASVVVRRLVDAGFVTNRRAANDSRRVDILLTARGRALQRKIPLSAPQLRLTKALATLSGRDIAMFTRLLGSVVAGMDLDQAPAPMLFSGADDPPRAKKKPAGARSPRRQPAS